MKRGPAIGHLLAAATLWSTGGFLIKSVDWTPMGIAGGRSAIAALVLFALCRPFHFTWSFAQIGGALAYTATVILFVTSNKMTTAANAILLQFTAPIYVALFGARYLGEKTSRFDWLTIVFAFGGMTLFFADQITTRNAIGNILAILSGISFAWLVLFLRKQKDSSPLESIVLGNALGAFLCLPFALGSAPPLKGWIFISALGVFQLALAYYLYSKAIKHVSAIEAILVTYIEPVLNPIWVLLLMGEKPGKMALIGGAIILGAVIVRSLVPTFRSQSGDTIPIS
ncbi:MAG: EamA family transporter [Pseudomonadota bacterium]